MKPYVRIGVVHATQVSIDPIAAAFAQEWPEAEVVNILDDSLSIDRARACELTDELVLRIEMLSDYAQRCGAQAVLFACSAFGQAIDAVTMRSNIPVLKPNDAMFRTAAKAGDDLVLLHTFEPAGPSMAAEFEELAREKELSASLQTSYVPGALEALQSGNVEEHDALIASAAENIKGASSILLGQFSMASAANACRSVTDIPIQCSPSSAVADLRAQVGNKHEIATC